MDVITNSNGLINLLIALAKTRLLDLITLTTLMKLNKATLTKPYTHTHITK